MLNYIRCSIMLNIIWEKTMLSSSLIYHDQCPTAGRICAVLKKGNETGFDTGMGSQQMS